MENYNKSLANTNLLFNESDYRAICSKPMLIIPKYKDLMDIDFTKREDGLLKVHIFGKEYLAQPTKEFYSKLAKADPI